MLANGKTYSLACWVKVKSVGTNGWAVKLGTNTCGLWWGYSPARWVWNENDNGKNANKTLAADTNWHHLVITVDKNLKPVDDVQLMVGQAVDIVGQTGNPRTISGFQIHNSPAVINTGERCEINGEDIKTYSDVLEGVIIIEDNRKREEK